MVNFLSLQRFERKEIDYLLQQAAFMENNLYNLKERYNSKILAAAFFEPSTRTKLSFFAAAQRLGFSTLDYLPEFSSQKKGESIEDTIKILSGYCDVLVVRHPKNNFFSDISCDCTLINAGDGTNEHPTQAIIDLYTIKKAFSKIDGLNFLIVGDLKNGRTVHSLLFALANYDVYVNLFCPKGLSPDKSFLDKLSNDFLKRISFTSKMDLSNIDVLYVTRVQYERFKGKKPKNIENSYVLTPELLSKAKKELKILHPLPRLKELPQKIDSTPYAHYFQQARNGVPVRMAILDYCLKK
ncbi:MAG: aspartate carbamoyltransferase [Candidatus Anstonellaceae archaeon]